MDHKTFFIQLITGFLNKKYGRTDIAHKMAMEIGIDEVEGDHHDLLKNCEVALRHIDHKGYYTTEAEFKYYLSCLKNERKFDEEERNSLLAG